MRSLEPALADWRRNPLDHTRYTNLQIRWLSVVQRLALWRGGNQIGKSYAQAADIIHTARGTHPYRATPRLPVRLLVVGESWAQMDPLVEKLWNLLPKDEIEDHLRYEPANGIRGRKNPAITFRPGTPGHGSTIVLATYKQGAKRIAGGSFHGVYLDEPCPESVYGEIMGRLSKWHGYLRLSLTPTPESPPMQYLRDIVDAGGLHEQRTSVTLDAMTLRGGLIEQPWKTPEQHEEWLSSLIAIERDMREHGGWDPIVADRILSAFDAHHVVTRGPSGEIWTAVGIDHGAKAGRQAAVLVGCTPDGETIWYMDEAVSDGRTSPQDDARGILDMLRRNGVRWQAVDYWVGDRAHSGDIYGNAKSNVELHAALARELDITSVELSAKGCRLATPQKGRGIWHGLRVMNGLFAANRSYVHMRCAELIKAIRTWKGQLQTPEKDRIDAARYAVERLRMMRRFRAPVGATSQVE